MGDFVFIARIKSLSRADLYTKSGIMARESLDTASRHVYILIFPDNDPRNHNNGGFEFQYRSTQGGDSKAIYPSSDTMEPPEFPASFPNTWMKLARTGDKFDSYYSTSGNDWRSFSSHVLKMAPQIYLGFAVTSHHAEQTVTTKVRDIYLLSGRLITAL